MDELAAAVKQAAKAAAEDRDGGTRNTRAAQGTVLVQDGAHGTLVLRQQPQRQETQPAKQADEEEGEGEGAAEGKSNETRPACDAGGAGGAGSGGFASTMPVPLPPSAALGPEYMRARITEEYLVNLDALTVHDPTLVRCRRAAHSKSRGSSHTPTDTSTYTPTDTSTHTHTLSIHRWAAAFAVSLPQSQRFWKPDMRPEDLFLPVTSESPFLLEVQRDPITFQANVSIITTTLSKKSTSFLRFHSLSCVGGLATTRSHLHTHTLSLSLCAAACRNRHLLKQTHPVQKAPSPPCPCPDTVSVQPR